MRFLAVEPPRTYSCGVEDEVVMSDVGRLDLGADEQVTLTTDGGAEYDVARKSWGFYATPSLNGRLERFGLRPVVVRNTDGRYFLLLVERGHEEDFERYVRDERLSVKAWLDTDEALEAVFGG